MKCSLIVTLLTALPTLLISAEPSAFGAGDLNSPNPYGLTSSEKVILETKKTLNKVSVKSNNQENALNSLRERIDGLQSVIESLSRKAHNNKIDIYKLDEARLQSTQSSDEYDKRIAEIVELNKKEIDAIKIALEGISKTVDKVSATYVSKDEFNSLVEDVNSFKSLVSKEIKVSAGVSSKPAGEKTLSSAEVYDRAKMNFDRKYYTDAIEDYEYLIKNNYKPAYSHYMIGEMNFRRNNYANAISYFKKSASLYSKASYMPNLMLHTAVSMQKSGDSANAASFYKALIKKYPNTPEAIEAKEYLLEL